MQSSQLIPAEVEQLRLENERLKEKIQEVETKNKDLEKINKDFFHAIQFELKRNSYDLVNYLTDNNNWNTLTAIANQLAQNNLITEMISRNLGGILGRAIQEKQFKCAYALINAGAKLKATYNFRTSLDYAITSNCDETYELVSYLIKKDVNIYKQSKDGNGITHDFFSRCLEQDNKSLFALLLLADERKTNEYSSKINSILNMPEFMVGYNHIAIEKIRSAFELKETCKFLAKVYITLELGKWENKETNLCRLPNELWNKIFWYMVVLTKSLPSNNSLQWLVTNFESKKYRFFQEKNMDNNYSNWWWHTFTNMQIEISKSSNKLFAFKQSNLDLINLIQKEKFNGKDVKKAKSFIFSFIGSEVFTGGEYQEQLIIKMMKKHGLINDFEIDNYIYGEQCQSIEVYNEAKAFKLNSRP